MRDVPAAVGAVDWLVHAPAHVVAELVDASVVISLREGEPVYTSGGRPERLFILISGRVGAWRQRPGTRDSDDGIWYYISDISSTTLCLENVITAIPYFATMRVISERAELLEVPAQAIAGLLDTYPAAGIDMARHIARRLQGFTEQTVDAALLDTGRHLAKYLIRLARPDGTTRAMTQTDLAARLGTSRQSVNAALSRFVHRGWVESVGRGRYRVLDADALRRHAGDSPTAGAELFH